MVLTSATGAVSKLADGEDAVPDQKVNLDELPWGLRWRVLRQLAGVSAKDLANAIGKDATELSSWENDRRVPRDPDEWDRKIVEALERIGKKRATVRLPIESTGDLREFLQELERHKDEPWRITERKISDGRVVYEVEFGQDGLDEAESV